MDNPQDCLVTSSQDVIETCALTAGHPSPTYQIRSGRKKKLKNGNELFPWYSSFHKLACSILGSSRMDDLLNVITVYTEHVSRDVVTSYSKPNRAAKLKTNMISMLGFFHNCYKTIKKPFEEGEYLEKMSNLLTMYFDMEVKASRRGKESMKRITSKIISALFLILNDSAEYILDTILKARFTVKSYSEICIPIFNMVTNLPQSQEMNYVRCLLVFKLWKRMLPCREERNSINRLAAAKLSPPPTQVLEFLKRGLLANVLPTPPEDKWPPLITRFYMTKKFNVRESIKAFFKMEAEFKLNDFTSALDSIRFLDDDESDMIPMERNFERDYSLLETIWIDISSSPASSGHSISSPSTSDSTSLDVAFSRNDGTSRVLEVNKTTPSKVKKSLFKPKPPKKNKQRKKKSKVVNSRKKKERLIIDLCKEYEGNCSNITQNSLESLESSPGESSLSQDYRKISISSTAINEFATDLELESSSTAINEFATDLELESSVASETIPELNSSGDLTLKSKNEKDSVKANLEEESKSVVESGIKTDASSVSNICEPQVHQVLSPSSTADASSVLKSCSSICEPQVHQVLSPSSTALKKFAAEAAIISQSIPEVNSSEDLKLNCKLDEEDRVKTNIYQDSSLDPEMINSDLKEITEIKIATSEKEEMKTDLYEETNFVTESKDLIELVKPENKMLITESKDLIELVKPENKMLISCKNFSKIGFKHEESEEKVDEPLNAKQEEIISTFEITEDPIFKTENSTDDSSHFKDDETSSDKLLLLQMEHDGCAGKFTLDNSLKDDGLAITSFTNSHSISQDVCCKNLISSSIKTNTKINLSPESDLIKNIVHKEENLLNEESRKQIGESEGPVSSQIKCTHKDDSNNNFGKQMLHKQNYILETKKSDHVNNTTINKTVINSKNDSQQPDVIKDPMNRSQVDTSQTRKITPLTIINSLLITETDPPNMRTRSIQKSLNTINEQKKLESSSLLSDNSNQESSEVSSSVEGYQMKSSKSLSQLSSPIFIENEKVKSCKVEKELVKEFPACMKNSESSPKPTKSQIKEKCDKNTQVPSKQANYVTNKSNFIPSSQSSSKPKNDQFNKQAFNLHKGVNTCLLHKILGEEDCLKSGCLLKNSSSKKLPSDLSKNDVKQVSLKQELENSSELPSEHSTPTIPPLWNLISGIKLENDNENSRNLESIEEVCNTSSDFLVKKITEACNFKELDYNIGNECDNLNANYDCESDCEDRNLVIDEDIDSLKDHTETEDIQPKNGNERVLDGARSIVSSEIVTNNNSKHFKELGQKVWDMNIHCEKLNVVTNNLKQPSEIIVNNQKHPPGIVISNLKQPPGIVMNNLEQQSRGNKTSLEQACGTDDPNRLKNETLKKEQAGKHKLPRIIESNIKTSSLRNSYVSEASTDSSVRFRTLSNSEMLYTTENNSSYTSTQHYRVENASVNMGVPKHYTQPNIIKRVDLNVNIGQISPSYGVYSPYSVTHTNDSNSVLTKPNRDPRLGPVNVTNNSYHLKSNVNIQPHQIKSPDSISSINQSTLSSKKSKSASPKPVPSPSRYEAYTQYNVSTNVSVSSKQKAGSPVEQFCQRSPVGNDKYRNLETIHRKRDSPIHQFQESSVNKTSHTKINTYVEGSNLKDNSNLSFHKYNATEPKKMKPGETLYDNGNSLRDPLCLVKNKEDPRETYDFEFNVFPIAQEVEICSGSESVVGDWLYPASSEIGHPDWPIANEQNVIDSSVTYSQPPEQYLYSTMMKSDQGCALSETDQTCYIPLELQQIDNRHPNIVGKNINKEKLNLHLRTLEGDYNLSCSQNEFKEFYLSRDVSPTIPVPYPPQGRTDGPNSSIRCPCEQCTENHQKLLSNYNILTHFRNSKIKPLSVFPKSDEASFPEKDPNGEFDCSLPLKKRKTLTNSKVTEEHVLPSYPNTPMISIAQLELSAYEQGNQVIVPNPQSQWRDSMGYNPLNLVQPPSLETYDGQTRGKRKASKRRKSSR